MPTDSVRFWLEPDLNGLECLRATYVRHRFAPHAHQEFAIGVIESGAQRLRYRGAHEIMPERSLVVINPGEMHTGHAATSSGWTYSMIYPGQAVLVDVANQLGLRRTSTLRSRELLHFDPQLTAQFLHFHTVLRSGRASVLARQSLLLHFLTHLVTRYFELPTLPAPADHPAIHAARDYLHAHACEPVTLDELARICHLSPFHCARSFTRLIGQPPHAYQLQLRIREAKGLLLRGMSIAEVAAATGFADQSHLSNRFRAVTGITPGHYRKLRKNLQDLPREQE